MELSVTYKVLPNCDVWFKIEIVDKGDFPKEWIFIDKYDPHPDELLADLNSEDTRCRVIEGFHRNGEEARKLVKLHVATILDMLEKWRAIKAPADEEYKL